LIAASAMALSMRFMRRRPWCVRVKNRKHAAMDRVMEAFP